MCCKSIYLDGHVDLDTVRSLHLDTITHFNMSENTVREVSELLHECSQMLKGVSLIQELSPKALDQLVSYGERCSVRIMAARLNQIGIPALALDAWDAGIVTTSDFGEAKILTSSYDNIKAKFDRIDPNIVAVVTGFIGHDNKKRITTLGRSGSDLSATLLGAALLVDEIVFWKDTDGILSTDPRLVPDAVPIADVTYEEASELACFGAQVLHPVAMQPARLHNVPCRVKNSYNPIAEGTIITNIKTHDRLVSAITFKRDIKLMDFHAKNKLVTYGFLGQVFESFQQHKLSVDVLASSEVSISLTLDKKQQMEQIYAILDDLKDIADIKVKENKAILTLIADVSRSSEVLYNVFEVFAADGIQVEMMSQGFSKVNISFIVDGKDLDRAVQSLHQHFFHGGSRTILGNIVNERQKLEQLIKLHDDEKVTSRNLVLQ
jgi:aspartate kinase